MLNSFLCSSCKNPFIRKSKETTCSLRCRITSDKSMYKTEDGCWIWDGGTAGDYGKVRFNGKTLSTHKASFITFNGEVPKGKWVCHSCDNPLCINPDHLFLGSPSDNRRDCVQKKRMALGQDHKWAKLTNIQIDEVRKLKQEGMSYYRLSRIFDCSVTHLFNIIKNKIRV